MAYGICTNIHVLPNPKKGSILNGDKFTLHNLDLNLCSEDDVTTVSGKEFQT